MKVINNCNHMGGDNGDHHLSRNGGHYISGDSNNNGEI